jgi:hypothetical protein
MVWSSAVSEADEAKTRLPVAARRMEKRIFMVGEAKKINA